MPRVRERMSVRECHHEVISKDDLGLDAGRNDVPPAECDVGIAAEQSFHRRLCEVLAGELQLEAWMLRSDHSRQARDHSVRRHTGERDSDASCLAAVCRLDRVLSSAQCFQYRSRRFDQRGPACRQLHRTRVAVEQSGAKVLLELFDGPAQGRLRDVQPRCGPAEVKLFGDCEKGSELLDVHRVLLYYVSGNTEVPIKYLTDCNARHDSKYMDTLNPDVPDDVFADVLKQISHFVRSRVVPRELDIMNNDAIPADVRTQSAEMGLFGFAIPQEWGGLGLNLIQDVEVAMELGYTSLALRSMFGTNNGIAGQVLVGFGTEEQKAKWLPGMAAGDIVASFALTEDGAGSNPAGLKTTAKVDGPGWIINGNKRYITNAPIADMFVVFAKLDPKPESGNGIAVFLVPADTPGIEVGVKDAKMGQQGSGTADVTFTDVKVDAESLVGGNGDIGYKAAMTSLARGRVHIAALAVGQAQRALDESVSYAAASTQGGEPIGNFQLVQAMIADQQAGVMAGRAMVREAARAWVEETDRRIAPSAVKLFCTEMVGKVADLAVQIHGGAGYMREVPVERIYRDVRLLRLYEGTSEIQRLIVGGGLIRAEQKRKK